MMTEKGFTESVKTLRSRNSHLERAGDYWRPEEKEQLIEMFYQGIGLSEIAIRLQRTEPAVFQQIEKLDLFRRKDYPRRRKSFKRKAVCLCSACTVNPNACPHRNHEPRGVF